MSIFPPLPSIQIESTENDLLPFGYITSNLSGRAWKLLQGHKTEEVDKMLLTVRTMLKDSEWGYSGVGFIPAGKNGATQVDLNSQLNIRFRGSDSNIDLNLYAIVVELFYQGDDADTKHSFTRKSVKWSAYFAAIALGYMDAAGRMRKKAIACKKPSERLKAFDSVAAFMALCAEAMAYADRAAADDEIITEGISNSIKSRLSKAGHARHAKTDALKERFRAYFSAHSHLSKAQAARRFLDSLEGGDKKLLSSENAVRTLVAALKSD